MPSRKDAYTLKKLCYLLILCLLLCGCTAAPDSTEDPCAISHIDSENDGFCDRCAKMTLVIIDFYTVNDLHGKIADADSHPGVDELTTFIKNARETDDHVILLSAGDMWQGSSESNLTHGLLTTDWMNELGFAAMVMGNHEYDWGEDPIVENSNLAQFPFLAINIYDRETDKQVSYCQSSHTIDLGDMQIGIIGAMGDCYSSISADKVSDVYFKTGSELTQLVKEESDRLRENGVDYIVYVLHDGYGQSKSATATSISGSQLRDYYDVSLSDGYVDLVFEGHTHQRYILKDNHDVYHLQNKGDNKGISHVEICFNIANNQHTVETAELIATGDYVKLDDDPIVNELLDKYDSQISKANEILGTNTTQRNGVFLRQVVADLYYETGMEYWGDEYDIVLGGGFMSIRSPGELVTGDVTYGDIYGLFPFDNQLVLCSIKGKDLKERFFDSDNDKYFISYGDYGNRIKNDIDPDATYYIVTDTYSSLYAPNNLTEIDRFDENIFARDLLAQYIRDGGLSK